MASGQFSSRLLRDWGSLVLSVMAAFIAGIALIGSVSSSGYDPHENRAPEVRIIIAALAAAVGFAAVRVATRRVRGRSARQGPLGTLSLSAVTILLIVLWGIVVMASGPL